MVDSTKATTTTDHEEIRDWVEKQGGRPAAVAGSGSGSDPGVLRIDFGDEDEGLEQLDWDSFFRKFDDERLALVHATDDASRFNKLVHR